MDENAKRMMDQLKADPAALRRNRKRSAERRPSVSAERSRQQGDGTELGPAHPGKPNPVSQRACGERSAGVWPRFSLRTG